MSITVGGVGVNTKLEVNSLLAANCCYRHNDWSPWVPYSGGGAYGRKLASGNIAVTQSGSLFQFRWTSPQVVASIKRVTFAISTGATATTAGVYNLQMFAARAFSASGSGGTAFSGANIHGARRGGVMAQTQLGDLRIDSTTNTGLTAGTWSLDTDPMSAATVSFVAGATNTMLPLLTPPYAPKLFTLWESAAGDPQYIVASGEGFTIQQSVVTLSMTVFVSVTVEWEELSPSSVW